MVRRQCTTKAIGCTRTSVNRGDTLLTRWQGRACTSAAPRLILDHPRDANVRPVIAYASAWLQVAGGDSVLPP